jgi:hypothetical protein
VPRFLWPLIVRSALIISTSVVGMPCEKHLSGFQGSVLPATSSTDIEHDLVVIPVIIRRRDIHISPPVDECPLIAQSGRCRDFLNRSAQQVRIMSPVENEWALAGGTTPRSAG